MNFNSYLFCCQVQHLTLFSLELHVRTRRDSRPDPEFDPICAIFYYIQTDTPLSNGKNKVKGIICVDEESAKGAATTGSGRKPLLVTISLWQIFVNGSMFKSASDDFGQQRYTEANAQCSERDWGLPMLSLVFANFDVTSKFVALKNLAFDSWLIIRTWSYVASAGNR